MFRVITYFLLYSTVLLYPILPESNKIEMYKANPIVKRLREYIQIDTTNGANSDQVVEYWRRYAVELDLPFAVYKPAGLPICVLTLIGSKPNLTSIMLNSHADVVPVEADLWTYPPFSAYIDVDGNMYGRGTQDTKSLGVQYLEAIRILLQNNITLERTLHVTVMPDEETGGFNGIIPFLETDEFKSLSIGFALDEGITSKDDHVYALYQDKRPWQAEYKIQGLGGHGSVMSNGTAVEKLQILINDAMEYRNEQIKIMKSSDSLDYGAYTTVNINIVEGGLAPNVIPQFMTVVIDMRLANFANTTEITDMLNSWLSKLGTNSTLNFLRQTEISPPTTLDDSNPYWVALRETMKDLNIPLKTSMLAATSDMVPVRTKGIPAIGFCTRRNMISRLHDNNEYIAIDDFLQGIDIYVELLKRLGTVQE